MFILTSKLLISFTFAKKNMTAPDNWKVLCEHLSRMFRIEVDFNWVLFLVGIRERVFTFQTFSKDREA